MRTFKIFAAAVALTSLVFACTSSTENGSTDDNVDQGPEQDITATKNQLKGSWDIDDASKDLSPDVAYEFNANGSFSRDVNKALNGVFLPGSPPPTEHQTGKYKIDATKHLVTLNITSPNEMTETLAYEYTAGRVLNGVFLPGQEPSGHPTLKLTGQAAPGSHVAFPTITYNQIQAVGAEGSTCGGFVGLPCQAGLVCKASASCCDIPGKCVASNGPPPGALGMPLPAPTSSSH